MKVISKQIDTIRSLKDGWLDGEGVVPTEEGLQWVEEKIEKFFGAEEMPLPFIYPTPSGGIQIEWHRLDDFSLEIDLEKKYGEFYSMKDEEIGYVVIPDLKSDIGWEWVAKRVKGKKDD